MICNLKIGDKVKVKSWGWLYSSYEEMALLLNATNWKSERGISFNNINNRNTYIIKNYEEHPQFSDEVVVLIEDEKNGEQFLVGYRSLVNITPPFIGEEEFAV